MKGLYIAKDGSAWICESNKTNSHTTWVVGYDIFPIKDLAAMVAGVVGRDPVGIRFSFETWDLYRVSRYDLQSASVIGAKAKPGRGGKEGTMYCRCEQVHSFAEIDWTMGNLFLAMNQKPFIKSTTVYQQVLYN